ncbi:GTPase-activating protein BEM3 [Aspergillus undulatus]|uniref:GTPase-activating protein BEM3 n=1 Tax=Aspergillus undulatus TaxID=1810928 RepID=UPI003CCDF4DE
MSQAQRQGSGHTFSSLHTSFVAPPTGKDQDFQPSSKQSSVDDLISGDFLALRSGAQAIRSESAVGAAPRKHTPSPLHTSTRTLSPQRTDSSLSQRTASPSSSTTTSPLENLSTINEIAHAAFPTSLRTSPLLLNASHASRKRTPGDASQNDRKMTEQMKDFSKARKDSDAAESSKSMSPSIMSPISSLQLSTREKPGHRAMPRTSSIDSAISSLSSASQTHKSSFDANAVSQADIDHLVTAAGSPDAVIIHLLKEKHHAASQNTQLWKLVDKQRALIMGLNKDLERAMKDKERYKKKVKDLQAAAQQISSTEVHSAQPPTAGGTNALNGQPPIQGICRSGTAEQPSQASTVTSQDSPGTTPSLKQLIQTELLTEEPDLRFESQSSQQLASIQETSPASQTPLASPNSAFSASKSQKSPNPARKPPPAPLNLGHTDRATALRDASDSDSEYEDILAVDESPIERGRRKTRADDDRERKAVLSREAPDINPSEHTQPLSPRTVENLAIAGFSSPEVRRVVPSDSLGSAMSPRMVPPSLADRHIINGPKSPGLPLSPRPEDRPLGSPMPRMPREIPTSFSSMTMPSVNSLSGLALTPRLGKQPIPFPSGASTNDPLNRPIPSIDAAVRIDSPQSTGSMPSGIYQGLRSDDYPTLLLPPNALPLIRVKVSSSRLRPSRNSYLASRQMDEEPVFTLSVFSRSENLELWRVEKVIAALPQLDHQLRQLSHLQVKLPDRSIFSGHSPAKVDARRAALNSYFEILLDSPMDERAALVICQFLTSDAIEPRDDETSLLKGSHSPVSELTRGPDGKPKKEGYLTKRGKNFGGWKARYFVLHGPELRYFEAPGGAHLGTIKIPNAQIGKQSQPAGNQSPSSRVEDDDSDNQYRHAFLILEPKKKDSSALVRHVLCAESDDERDTWVEALLEYVEGPPENEGLTSAQMQAAASNPASTASRNKMFSNGGRKGSKGTDSPDIETSDTVQGFSFEDAVPAEPPIIGTDPRTPKSPGFPTGSFHDASDINHADHGQISSKMISAPTNGVVIQDAGAWGNKTSTKEKKRSIWGFRTRSSMDLASQLQAVSEGPPVQVHGAGGDKRELIKPVFGIPLVEAVRDCAPFDVDVELPAVVYRCLEYLRAKGAEFEEGIFRLSGSNVVVKALRERFNTEGDVDFLAGDQYYDVHAVASLFKQYLRELPSTVLTRELHIEFLRVLDFNEKQKKIVAFNSLVHRLPRPNIALLRALVQFLIVIVNNSDVNKMTVRNVGIVFAPTLNIPAPVFSMFLTDYEEIFDDVPESSASAKELTIDHPLTPEDIRSPRRQMFSDIPTPAHNQVTFPRPGDRSDEYSSHHDTGFIPMQPTYEAFAQNRTEGHNYPPAAVSRMLAPESDNARNAKAKRRESNILFMDFNNDDQPPPARDDVGKRSLFPIASFDTSTVILTGEA